jgi:alanine dehydrogenase
MVRTVGLPRMHKEAGERRDFLPEFVAHLELSGAAEIVIEEGYGQGMGLTPEDYLRASKKVRFADYDTCFGQDLVAVVRCPSDDAIKKMRRGSILLSMLHYPTRPGRVAMLQSLGIHGVSLDGLTDDLGVRLVENLESVGWNGVQAAFAELRKRIRHFDEPQRRPTRVVVMGSGYVGGHALRAATRYGDAALREQMARKGVPGVMATVVDYDFTRHENVMLDLLEHTDLLVDATARPDPSKYVIPNEWVAALPAHAVMLDLSVDPYDFTIDPPEVKGIEGMPEGNLDQWVFQPDDPAYERLDPRVGRTHRRTALSCYSWPGVHPKACMEIYGKQIQPIARVLFEAPVGSLDATHGRFFERATARAEVNRWKSTH